ncbi:MAG: MATE family efflux transporter [Lachnospiraceae bacterium]|nr:MATE family efflux transporter [Lachnospiraceae bacterium]
MTKNLTSGNPAKLILLFALPLIIGNVFQQLYSMADTLIVGRTIGVNALAAVGCTGSITFFVLGFVMGLTGGLSIITAQRFGAEDFEGVRRSFAVSIVVSVTSALLITLIAVPLARPFLVLLKTPAEILDAATGYLQIIFIGTLANVAFNLLSNVIRALGDSRTPLYFLIFACLVNIVLDFVFILGFGLGVNGAGIATIASQLLSAILCVIYIKKKMPLLCIRRSDFHIEKSEISKHLGTALPMGFQMSIIAIGSLILQSALNGLGAVSVAAYTAASKIDMIATMPLNSLGQAMATYCAQNYGANKMHRIRQGVFQCVCISIGVSVLMGLMNFFLGYQLTGLFVGGGETEVLSLAQTFLRINGCLYWVLALLFIFRFSLQGLGNSVIPTVAGIMELIMRAIGGLLLTDLFGFTGAAVSNPLAWFGAFVPLTIAYIVSINRLDPKEPAPNPQQVS